MQNAGGGSSVACLGATNVTACGTVDVQVVSHLAYCDILVSNKSLTGLLVVEDLDPMQKQHLPAIAKHIASDHASMHANTF